MTRTCPNIPGLEIHWGTSPSICAKRWLQAQHGADHQVAYSECKNCALGQQDAEFAKLSLKHKPLCEHQSEGGKSSRKTRRLAKGGDAYSRHYTG